MPWSGGTFSRSNGTYTGSTTWKQTDDAGTGILSTDHDTHDQDLATGINTALAKDGQNSPTANLPMGTYRHTGVGNASARTDYAAAGQVADSSLIYAGTSSGTDTITASVSPAITAYAAGQKFHFKAGGTNTGAATININSVGAKDIKKGPDGATALTAGDITADGMYTIGYDGTNFQLENPGVTITTAGAALLDDANASAQRTTLGLGTIATQDASSVAITGGSISDITDLAVADGGTGASDAASARTNLGAVLADAVFPGAIIAILEHNETSGTDGGTFTSGADRTRTINTVVYNRNTTVTLSSNQFTLPAGTWFIKWVAPVGCDTAGIDYHQSLLYDVTNTTTIKRGESKRTDKADFSQGFGDSSNGSAVVTPSGSTTYEIRHRCSSTESTDGFGNAASHGTEVYTRVEIYAA